MKPFAPWGAALFATFAIYTGPAVAAPVSPVPPGRHNPAGRDAFLPRQVYSINDLVNLVGNSPALQKRYARHFGVGEAKVMEFFKNALTLYTLPAGRQVTTYGVTRTGRIYPVRQYLPKGTKVWATRSGLPILKWACANPLTKSLPGTLLAGKPKNQPKKRQAGGGGVAPAADVATVSSAEVEPASDAAPVLAAVAPEEPLVPPVVASVPLPTGGASSAILPPLPGGGGGPEFLPLLGVLGISIFGRGGGSDRPADGHVNGPLPVAPSSGVVTPGPEPTGFTDGVVGIPIARPVAPPAPAAPDGGTGLTPSIPTAAPEPGVLPLAVCGAGAWLVARARRRRGSR